MSFAIPFPAEQGACWPALLLGSWWEVVAAVMLVVQLYARVGTQIVELKE
jgi:hypothetical protein